MILDRGQRRLGALPKNLGGLPLFLRHAISFQTGLFFLFTWRYHSSWSTPIKQVRWWEGLNRTCVSKIRENGNASGVLSSVRHQRQRRRDEPGGEIFKKKFAWVRLSCHAVLVWIPCFPESGVLASGLQARPELGEERSWALPALPARPICKAPVFLTHGRGCFLSSYRGLTDYIKRQFLLNSGTSTKKVPVSDNQPQLILSAQVGLFVFSFF